MYYQVFAIKSHLTDKFPDTQLSSDIALEISDSDVIKVGFCSWKITRTPRGYPSSICRTCDINFVEKEAFDLGC